MMNSTAWNLILKWKKNLDLKSKNLKNKKIIKLTYLNFKNNKKLQRFLYLI